MRISAAFRLIAFLAAACPFGPAMAAVANLPALSREFRTERYVADESELESVRAQRHVWLALSGGAFQRGEDAGSANPFGDWKKIGGGTLDAGLQLGRFAFGASGVADTRRAVDGGEFPKRLFASAYVPEARISLVGAAGFGEHRFAGVDLTAQTLAARWQAIGRKMDLYPRIWTWARIRRLDAGNATMLTPAAGMFLQHGAVVGSQPYLGVSAQSDLLDGRLPLSRAMAQFGWGWVPRPLWSHGDPDFPEAEVSDVSWNGFLALAWSVPLDRRDEARFVAQAGVRFLRPFGR